MMSLSVMMWLDCMTKAMQAGRVSLWAVPQDWVVSSLVLKYKLVRGKYEREHNRLDVQEMSR